jgi:predicted  nucleic acid-binding Zn-ribbon protein
MLRKIDEKPEPSKAVPNSPKKNQEPTSTSQAQSTEVAEKPAEEEQLPMSVHDKRVKIEEQMNDLSHQYAQLRNDLKTNLFTEKDDFETKKETLDNYLETLKRDESESTEKLADTKAQNDDAAKEQLAHVKADRKDLEAKLSDLQDRLKDLNSDINARTAHLESLQTNLAKNEQSESDMSTSIKEEKDLQKMLVLMEKQKNSINTLYDQRKDLKTQINSAQENIANLTSNADELNTNISDVNNQIEDLVQKAKDINDKMKNDHNYRIETIAGLERHLQSLDEEHKKIDGELSEVNNNIDYITKYIKDVFHSAYLVRDVYLDKEKQYFVATDKFDSDADQNDLFGMVNYLETKLQKPVTIVSTFYNNHLHASLDQKAKDLKIAIPNVVNLFEQLQASPNPTDKKVAIPENQDWVTRTDVESQDTFIYDQKQTLLMTVEYFDKKIDRINYYKNDQIVKTNIYNGDGQLSSMQKFNQDKQLTEQSFYRTDGSIVLTIIFDKNNAISYQLFDKNGLLEHDFNEKSELITWWLKSISPDTENAVFVGNNSDLLYQLITSVNSISSDNTILLLQNVAKRIDDVITLLDKKSEVHDIFVQSEDDLHAIENKTNRDISVSVINTMSDGTLSLPVSLKI